ncbi:hypothetical protein [Pantoea vagans]|uniref:hypothetical protein n=1 Tax=Pantoea vagans TaxID=470934 RepID=UPI0023AFE06A|nr:hypothetical protein [Pantoea vagans]MDE8556138.1 hypothetical protein [Pantoea vagans]MDE8576189.1 hypothetical protein [Pantoea vagans]
MDKANVTLAYSRDWNAGQLDQADASFKHGGGNGGGDDMLERVKKLEDQVSAIGTDIAVIKATICTKEDLQKELNGQTWKIIIALVVTVLIAVLSKYFIK